MVSKRYAYRVTDVTGTQVGKMKVGEFMLEKEYLTNGSYTWKVFNFKDPTWPLAATITGVYVGIVYLEDGKLTEESKELLAA